MYIYIYETCVYLLILAVHVCQSKIHLCFYWTKQEIKDSREIHVIQPLLGSLWTLPRILCKLQHLNMSMFNEQISYESKKLRRFFIKHNLCLRSSLHILIVPHQALINILSNYLFFEALSSKNIFLKWQMKNLFWSQHDTEPAWQNRKSINYHCALMCPRSYNWFARWVKSLGCVPYRNKTEYFQVGGENLLGACFFLDHINH